MKTADDIKAKICEIKKNHAGVLTGSTATVDINAPRALMQISAESRLEILHWVLGTEYKSKLKGVNR